MRPVEASLLDYSSSLATIEEKSGGSLCLPGHLKDLSKLWTVAALNLISLILFQSRHLFGSNSYSSYANSKLKNVFQRLGVASVVEIERERQIPPCAPKLFRDVLLHLRFGNKKPGNVCLTLQRNEFSKSGRKFWRRFWTQKNSSPIITERGAVTE